MSRAVSSDGPVPRLKRFVTAKECAEVMAKTECSLAARELLHRTEPCTIPSRKSFVEKLRCGNFRRLRWSMAIVRAGVKRLHLSLVLRTNLLTTGQNNVAQNEMRQLILT
jgi:hypothetical protein